jgi:hypothetical protein
MSFHSQFTPSAGDFVPSIPEEQLIVGGIIVFLLFWMWLA